MLLTKLYIITYNKTTVYFCIISSIYRGEFNMPSDTNKKFSIEEEIMIIKTSEKGTSPHNHSFYELVYVLDGSAYQNISGSTVRINRGDYYIIDYNTVHSYKNCRNFRIINCLFKPEFIDKTLKGCDNFSKLINNYLIHFNYSILSKIPADNIFHDKSGDIKKLFESMYTEFEQGSGGYIELMRCYIIQILVLSLRSIYLPYGNRTNHITQNIIQYIEKHYADHITLKNICSEMNFTLPYLSKKFKDDTGLTFQQYLQNMRIEQSCRLLSETDKRITEIANDVGYSDIKFFGEVFRKTMNMSPREFRSRIRNDR